MIITKPFRNVRMMSPFSSAINLQRFAETASGTNVVSAGRAPPNDSSLPLCLPVSASFDNASVLNPSSSISTFTFTVAPDGAVTPEIGHAPFHSVRSSVAASASEAVNAPVETGV